MNRQSSHIGSWLSAALALSPLGVLLWAISATSGSGFA
jgi:hypothetical protein